MLSVLRRNAPRPTPFVYAAVVLLVGVSASAAVGLSLHRSEINHAETIMDQEIQTTSADVYAGIRRYVDAERSLANAVGAQSSLSEGDFQTITASLLSQDLPGATHVSFIVPAMDHEVAATQARWRDAGNPALQLQPFGSGHEHRFVVMTRNLDGGTSRVGGDASQSPQVMAAMDRARAINAVSSSESFVFLRDRSLPEAEQQKALVLIAPVFGGVDSDDAGQFRGWLNIGLRTHDFAVEVLASAGRTKANVAISEESMHGGTITSVDRGKTIELGDLKRHAKVDVAGRLWTLSIEPTTSMFNTADEYADIALFAVGSVVSVLLASLVWTLSSGRSRALLLVERATSDLKADVLRREETEEKLRLAVEQAEERSEFIQVLLDAMEVGVISCDSEGKPLFLNGMARRLLGIDGPTGTTPEQWGDRHEFLHADTREPLTASEQPLLRALEGENISEEIVLRLESGEHRSLAVNARSLRRLDGTVFGAVAVGHDVTLLKQEMNAKSELLREVEAQRSLYADLLTGISELGEGVVIAEGEHFVFANRAMSEMSGYSEEELLAMPSHLQLLRPDERENWLQSIAEIEQGDAGGSREITLVTKSGEEIPIEIVSKALHIGDRVQRLGVVRDIRARREIENALAAHAEGLIAANKEFVEFEALRADFLASVSHDFRTPLTAVMGFVELSLDCDDDTPLMDLRMYLDRASHAAAELHNRVESFLDFSRAERMGVDLQLAPVQLDEVLPELLAQLAPVLDRNPVNMHITNACVAIENRAFTRVIENLLTNAIKYSPEGSCIDVRTAVHASEVVISVEDRGSGIAPENLERVFDSYFRSDDVRGSVKGSGVGLAVVRQLVEGMNGRVWVANREGGGSAFYVALPFVSAAVSE